MVWAKEKISSLLQNDQTCCGIRPSFIFV